MTQMLTIWAVTSQANSKRRFDKQLTLEFRENTHVFVLFSFRFILYKY